MEDSVCTLRKGWKNFVKFIQVKPTHDGKEMMRCQPQDTSGVVEYIHLMFAGDAGTQKDWKGTT